eukprot:3266626-Pleurochrysis_carterae.AAC.1
MAAALDLLATESLEEGENETLEQVPKGGGAVKVDTTSIGGGMKLKRLLSRNDGVAGFSNA